MLIGQPYHRCMTRKRSVSEHPMVTRLLKWVFRKQPPQPHYIHTLDVGVVTSYISSQGENKSLSLQELSHKLAMLMALMKPSRSADLTKLDLDHSTYSVEGMTFIPATLSKQIQQQKHGTEFHFPQDGLLYCSYYTYTLCNQYSSTLHRGVGISTEIVGGGAF